MQATHIDIVNDNHLLFKEKRANTNGEYGMFIDLSARPHTRVVCEMSWAMPYEEAMKRKKIA